MIDGFVAFLFPQVQVFDCVGYSANKQLPLAESGPKAIGLIFKLIHVCFIGSLPVVPAHKLTGRVLDERVVRKTINAWEIRSNALSIRPRPASIRTSTAWATGLSLSISRSARA